jgi:protein O-mannosyl-transferase
MCINPLQDGIKLAAVRHHEALHAGKEDPGLAILYPHPRLWPIWLVVGAALPIIATTVMVILKAKKIPYLAVGWLWYVGTLVPVIRLVQVGMQTRADRYTYIPLIWLFIIVA